MRRRGFFGAAATLLASSLLGCSSKTRAQYVHSARFFKGDFPNKNGPIRITPGGIRYSSTTVIDELELDFVFDSTEQCLREAFPDGIVSDSEIQSGGCNSIWKKIDYNRDLLVVVGPWMLNCKESEQLLKVEAPQLGCDAKGLPRECGCHWRSGIKDGIHWYESGTRPIVNTTPSFYMLPDALATLWTGCSNVWITEQVRQCARPITKRL